MEKNKLQKASSCSRKSVTIPPLPLFSFAKMLPFQGGLLGCLLQRTLVPAPRPPGMALSPSLWSDQTFVHTMNLHEQGCENAGAKGAAIPSARRQRRDHWATRPCERCGTQRKSPDICKSCAFPREEDYKNSVRSLVEYSILLKNLGGLITVSELESVHLGHSGSGLWDRPCGTGTVKWPQLIFQGHDKSLSERLGPQISCPDWSLWLVCSLHHWGGLRGLPQTYLGK